MWDLECVCTCACLRVLKPARVNLHSLDHILKGCYENVDSRIQTLLIYNFVPLHYCDIYFLHNKYFVFFSLFVCIIYDKRDKFFIFKTESRISAHVIESFLSWRNSDIQCIHFAFFFQVIGQCIPIIWYPRQMASLKLNTTLN